MLRNSRGLLGKQSATIPVNRIQAVRIVEGFWRMLIGYCTLQVEVAGIGPANTNQRMLFPLLKTDRAEALIRRALPELPWPTEPLLPIPQRVHRRYLTLPLEYGAGFTLLFLLLPGWWKWLAMLPLPLGLALGIARPREARWQVDDHSVRVPLAAAHHPQHGDRLPDRGAEHRVVEFTVEGAGACRRIQDEVLLRTPRQDQVHGRGRCADAAARDRTPVRERPGDAAGPGRAGRRPVD